MSQSPGAISVLHVDDDSQARALVSRFFERRSSDFSVISASSGVDALDVLDDGVDCIVSDYDMPNIDGIELLRAVRTDYADLPFVLLTGRGSETVASEAVSAGATDYFRKTGTLDGLSMLARRVENAVARRRAEVSHRELFEKAAEGFALHDPETGAFVDANASAQRLLGYERDELLAMTVDDVTTVSPSDARGRGLLPHVRRATETDVVTREEYCRCGDGTPFWMTVQFTAVTVNGRTLVLSQMRDITARKRYERTLTSLHVSMADLAGADSPRQVTACVQAAVDDLLDAEHAAVFLHDATENRLTVASGTAASAVTEVNTRSVPLSADSPVADVFIEGVPVETADAAVFGTDRESDSPLRALVLPLGDAGVLALGTEQAAFGGDVREFAEVLASAATVAFDRIRTDRENDSNRAELRSRTDEMERLTRTNSTLHDLSSHLLTADTLEDAYEAVCTALAELPSVALTWVGVPGDENVIDPLVWSGSAPQYLDTAVFDPETSEPATVAARTGRTVRVDDTARNRHTESWRRTALSHGVKAVLAVPFDVDGVTYGVLSVLIDGQSVLDDRFHEMVSTIATWTSETVSSIEHRRDVLAPTPATVTYALDPDAHFLGRLAAEVDGRIDLVGALPESADRHRVVLTVSDADPVRVGRLADALAATRTVDVVSTESDGGTVELGLATPLLDVDLAAYTAAVTGLRATPTAVQFTATIAHSKDVRNVADAIRGHHPDATLLAKRQRSRALDEHDRVRSFRETLTPRQHEVVQVAFLNGYFDTPRRCNGDELGDQLGISAQAVYQHLRSAQRKLFTEVFDASPDSSPESVRRPQ